MHEPMVESGRRRDGGGVNPGPIFPVGEGYMLEEEGITSTHKLEQNELNILYTFKNGMILVQKNLSLKEISCHMERN